MRSCNLAVKVIGLVVLSLAVVIPSWATKVIVRGGSNYGSNSLFSDCLTGNVENACEAFDTTPTLVTFNGTTFDIFQFVTGSTGITGTVFNIVDLGLLGANTTFTLPPAFFDPALTEVFSCNDQADLFNTPSANLFDSGQVPMAGACTPNLTSAPDIDQTGGIFTTGPNFNVSDLVLDSPVPTAAPEPASLVLLGVGLFALGRKFRRAS